MATVTQVTAATNHNRRVIARRRELNAHAGRKQFPVPTRVEFRDWLQERLAGARSIAEIADLNAIMLPELDLQLVDEVLKGAPEAVNVADRLFLVNYPEHGMPYITLPNPAASGALEFWDRLPETMPEARGGEILVRIEGKSWSPASTIAQVKFQYGAEVDMTRFSAWRDRPRVLVPDLEQAEAAEFPELLTHELGTSLKTGAPLVAYGFIDAYRSFGTSTGWNFVCGWSINRDDALSTHSKAREVFAQARGVRQAEVRQTREQERERQVSAGELRLRLEFALERNEREVDSAAIWVIKPDGSEVEPVEELENPWRVVYTELGADLLVVSMEFDRYGRAPTPRVLKQPSAGPTSAQLQKAKELEKSNRPNEAIDIERAPRTWLSV